MNIKNSFSDEIIISLIMVVLLLLLINPFDFWMPTMLAICYMLVLFILFAMFVGVIWKEHTADEREALHRDLAGRIAFLVGSGVLLIGISVQYFEYHRIDMWLVITLVTMVVAKIAGLTYGNIKN